MGTERNLRNKERMDSSTEPNEPTLASIAQDLRKMNDKISGMQTSLEAMFEEKLKLLNSSLEKSLNKKVESLRVSVTKTVNENKAALKRDLELTAKEIQDNVDMDIGQLTSRIEKMESSANKTARAKFDTDVSITVAGLPFEEGEETKERVERLLRDCLKCHPMPRVVNADRLKPRGTGPGLIKAELGSVEEKIAVLRRKQQLRAEEGFSRVYIQSAKSHAERLIDLNFRTLLREIPKGKDFYITGNGRLVKRDVEHSDRGGAAAAERTERSGRTVESSGH